MAGAEHAGLTPEVLAAFARALRSAGLPVTQDRTAAFLAAAAAVGVTAPDPVYWAGRATLCSDPDQLPVYDLVFRSWFGGELPRRGGGLPAPQVPSQVSRSDEGSGTGERGEEDVQVVRARASEADILRHRDIADLTPAERQALAALFSLLHLRPPQRAARRRVPSGRGDVDVRRTLREELRRAGEPGPLRYRRATTRSRRVVLLVDVSGSMEPYADSLLRLAHVWVRSAPRTTEVFTVGTRLTRITRALRMRDPDLALKAAGAEVPDWSGGTRLGEVLAAFLERWGRRGMARGAVVVIFSDGWERGDPAMLGEQMGRLARLAHRVVWANPHRGRAGYQPVQGGIAAALPHIDDFVAGHSLASFTELAGRVADA